MAGVLVKLMNVIRNLRYKSGRLIAAFCTVYAGYGSIGRLLQLNRTPFNQAIG